MRKISIPQSIIFDEMAVLFIGVFITYSSISVTDLRNSELTSVSEIAECMDKSLILLSVTMHMEKIIEIIIIKIIPDI